jgi:hypothetical protein
LGSEVSEMAEYKYPNPSCANFVQFGWPGFDICMQ